MDGLGSATDQRVAGRRRSTWPGLGAERARDAMTERGDDRGRQLTRARQRVVAADLDAEQEWADDHRRDRALLAEADRRGPAAPVRRPLVQARRGDIVARRGQAEQAGDEIVDERESLIARQHEAEVAASCKAGQLETREDAVDSSALLRGPDLVQGRAVNGERRIITIRIPVEAAEV